MQGGAVQRAIELGADVIGEGQAKVGTVASVVVCSPHLRVTEIVVNTGMLLGRNIVVPVGAITDIVNGKVYLAIDAHQLQQYPDYVNEDSLSAATDVDHADSTFVYGGDGRLIPMAEYEAKQLGKRICTPSGTVALEKGMGVESSDGARIASLEAVDTDTKTRATTSLLIAHGLLGLNKSWVPVGDVARVEANKVRLTLTKDQMQNLPRAASAP